MYGMMVVPALDAQTNVRCGSGDPVGIGDKVVANDGWSDRDASMTGSTAESSVG
jgi:hypothetical protein